MKKGIQFTLLLSIVSAGLHFYLSKRSYEIQAGEAKVSQICNINEKLNCDAVLTSSYSSVLGLPVSNFGFALNLFLAIILFAWLSRFLDFSPYWKNTVLYLSGFIALSSIVMFGISLSIEAFCPICLVLYILSFLLFGILFFMFRKDYQKTFLLKNIKNKLNLVSVGSIVILASFLHMVFVNQFNLKELKKINRLMYIDWTQAQVENFQQPPALQKGNPKSLLRIVEFADPLCSHCKKAHDVLKVFLKSHPDVNFQFYLFPLDKDCNSSMQHGRGGRSCELSKAILCGKKQNKGWEVHDLIFEKQSEFSNRSFAHILNSMEKETHVDIKQLKSCIGSATIKKELKNQVSVGISSEIPGTPALFVNEKRIRTGADLRSALAEFYKRLVVK